MRILFKKSKAFIITCLFMSSLCLSNENQTTWHLQQTSIADLTLTRVFRNRVVVTLGKTIHVIKVGEDLGLERYRLESSSPGRIVFQSEQLGLIRIYTKTDTGYAVETLRPAPQEGGLQ